ncbi:hypothetical protein MKW98_010921 [Papaver atlanticum]|uniref:Uncharacterized protein n=1 Tax=Papaver atlanticum TaxID=357466 RepID=A0AAD4SMD0_9MAGN|nr:hypothetical protein MKW98_010921 [Papaver atlanticum]
MHNSIARPMVNKLFTLARRFREPLRSLTNRWRKLCTDIGKVPVDQQIFGFENSLGKSDPIWIAMFTEKPQTLKEMRKMQEHYIALEEIQEGAQDRGVQEASTAPEVAPKDISKRPEKRSGPQYKASGKKEWVEKGKKPRHEPRTYTPLNAPLEEIFKELEKRNDIRYPKTRGIQFDKTKNHPEFCHYHQFIGHSTNDCREVQDIVQHLIRDGYLKQAVPGPDAPVHQIAHYKCFSLIHESDLLLWVLRLLLDLPVLKICFAWIVVPVIANDVSEIIRKMKTLMDYIEL